MDLSSHRNLYNGDCTHLFTDVYAPVDGPYTAGVLHRYVDLLADSGVDTLVMNLNASRAYYPSRVVDTILDGYTRGDRDFFRSILPPPNNTDFTAEMLEARLDSMAKFHNRYLDLVEAGVDWAAEIATTCRRRNISPWVSIRMNDMHGNNRWDCFFNNTLLRQEMYRLSGRLPNGDIEPSMQGMNYEWLPVREFILNMIRELVNEYDFEGIELDWLRCPLCCEPPVDQNTLDIMTGWMVDIRAITEARARETGKPYPLGLRIPPRLGLLRTIGLDVRLWAYDGLIDFISPSNFWQTTWDVPFDELRAELGDHITLYGCMDDAPNWLDVLHPASGRRGYRLLSASPELLRGNAAGKLAMGADGLEQFNFFCTDEPRRNPFHPQPQARYDVLQDLHNLETLRGQPKQYALASMHGHFMFPVYEYAEQIPAIIEAEGRCAFRLSMCKEPPGRQLTIQVVIEKQQREPQLGVSFNGSWPNFESQFTNELLFPTGIYTHHVAEHAALNFQFSAAQIEEGWNEIVVFNGDRSTPGVKIVSVELAVQ